MGKANAAPVEHWRVWGRGSCGEGAALVTEG